jgi:polyhydroxyalkanoate synthesis repressor PhaR
MSEERLIKKYANRRLYDAAQSRHITIDDIRNMVVAGLRVKVIEDKSNEDITRLVLLQVIADQEQFGRPILSTSLLESMIRFYGNSMQSYFSSYLEKSVETFIRQQEVLQAQLARASTGSPGSAANDPSGNSHSNPQSNLMAPLAELTRQNLELWAKMQETLLAAFAPPRDPSREPPPKKNPNANSTPNPTPKPTPNQGPDSNDVDS